MISNLFPAGANPASTGEVIFWGYLDDPMSLRRRGRGTHAMVATLKRPPPARRTNVVRWRPLGIVRNRRPTISEFEATQRDSQRLRRANPETLGRERTVVPWGLETWPFKNRHNHPTSCTSQQSLRKDTLTPSDLHSVQAASDQRAAGMG